jgi:hypothetical protein
VIWLIFIPGFSWMAVLAGVMPETCSGPWIKCENVQICKLKNYFFMRTLLHSPICTFF